MSAPDAVEGAEMDERGRMRLVRVGSGNGRLAFAERKSACDG